MKTLPPAQPYEDGKDGDDEGDQKGHQTSKEPVFRRWSHADAAQLRKTNPVISPWQVVLWMVMTSVVVGVIGLIAFDTPTALSGAYGSLAVALPAALLARGMTSPLSSMNAVSSALAFMLWEMVKIGLSIGMLMLAPSLIADLSWPALLAGLILAMQMYFVAAVFKPKPSGAVRRSKSAE